jgi:Spy/CpxP family protein refolding chaperone
MAAAFDNGRRQDQTMTKKRIILAAVAAAVIATVTLVGGAAAVLAQGPLAHGQRLLRIATVVLDLSDTQQTQIQAILDQNLTIAQPLLAQLQQTHQALEQAAGAGQTNDATLQPLANQLGQEVAQLAIIKAKATAQVHAVLTPEQLAKAEKVRGRMRERFRERWLQQ